MSLLKQLKAIGPAIVVAAVVLGPGSILMSSKVGMQFGHIGILFTIGAAILLFGMVTASARIGVVYEHSPCVELRKRVGWWASLIVGLCLFGIVASFQFGNNTAIVAAIESLSGGELSQNIKVGIIAGLNFAVIVILYYARNFYTLVEKLMKLLIFMMLAAFLVNFFFVTLGDKPERSLEILQQTVGTGAIFGLIATTFSVGGAFYQAYLVKEKKWTLESLGKGKLDSLVGVIVIALISTLLLSTASQMFFGVMDKAGKLSLNSFATALQPVFGNSASIIFSTGVLAGAFSSFLVNAIIGGTVFADSIGKGSHIASAGVKFFSALALVFGGVIAIVTTLYGRDAVSFIQYAQKTTLVFAPALALAILYLITRKELTGERRTPVWMVVLVTIGTIVTFPLAYRNFIGLVTLIQGA